MESDGVTATIDAANERVVLCDRSGRLLHAGCGTSGLDGACRWDDLGLSSRVVDEIERLCPGVAESGKSAVQVVPEDDGRLTECLLAPVPCLSGGPVAVAVVLRDVTAVRRAEEALRESERQYRLLAENATDMISRHDPAGHYLYVSPACRALTGFGPGELVGRSPYDFIHPDDLAEVHRMHSLMLASSDPFTVAFRSRRKEGAYAWLETTARAVRDDDGRVLEIQCASRDITPRKHAEQELREGRALFQAVLDNCPAVVTIKDVRGRYVLVNRRFEKTYGVARRQAVGRTDEDLFPGQQGEAFRAADRAVLVSGRAIEAEETATPPGGGPRALSTMRFPLSDPDGATFAVCAVASDTTARRRAEEALRAKTAVLRSILDNMADAVIVADADAKFLEFNPAGERMFGHGAVDAPPADWPERYGLFLPDSVTPFPAEDLPLARALRGETDNDVEMFVRHAGRPDGVWVLINGRPLTAADGRPCGGVVVCREITERKTAEAQLREQNVRLREAAEVERQAHDALKHAEVQLVQAEKLSALGQVVAGVAHEVNNPLAFVSNNMAVLQRDVAALGRIVRLYREADSVLEVHAPELLAPVQQLAEALDLDYTLDNLDRLTARSREGLRRIQQIVKDLRDFARPGGCGVDAVDLNVGVASTVNIIVGRAKRLGVEVRTELNPLPKVTCNADKINQVVMNLVANAIDACGSGGTVTVRTEPAPAGDGALLTVSDTGAGIDPGVRDRIFDPFFTTKPIGQGTGLGLSISYGIVKSHGGMIAVASEPGKGSTFTVRLPLTPPPSASSDPSESGDGLGLVPA